MSYAPKISVVMATQVKNVAYLEESIESILWQTEPEFELLIVFDGYTTAGANSILNKFTDARIRGIVSVKNRGLARSLNLGIKLSRSPLIARMDDDDRCLPNRIRSQVEAMRSYNYDVLGANAYQIDAEGQRCSDRIITAAPSNALSSFGAVFGSIFIHPAVVMRRDWALKNRYDPHWGRGQDRELWVRSALTSKFGHINQPLLEYRRQEGTQKKQMDNVRSAYQLILKHRNRFGVVTPLLLIANLFRHVVYTYGRILKYGR